MTSPSRRLVAVLNQWKPTAAGHQLIRGGNPSQADTGGKTQLETNNPTSSDEIIQTDPTRSANVNSVCENTASCNQPENFTDLGTGTTTTSVDDFSQNKKSVVKCSTTTSVNCTDI